MFQAVMDNNTFYGDTEELYGNDSMMTGLNQTLEIDCGLMSEEIETTYMACSFWMEGVLIICTST